VLPVRCVSLSFSFFVVQPPIVQAGPKTSDRDFYFDVRDYVAGSQRIAAHVCTLPATNRRFANKVPLPVQGRLINVVGLLSGPAAVSNGDDNIKRLPLELNEITFLTADGGPSTPVTVSGIVVLNGLPSPTHT
jgi:hypothetical protein